MAAKNFHYCLPNLFLGATFDLLLRDLMGVSSEFFICSIRFFNL